MRISEFKSYLHFQLQNITDFGKFKRDYNFYLSIFIKSVTTLCLYCKKIILLYISNYLFL